MSEIKENPVSRRGGENQVLTTDGKPILVIVEGSDIDVIVYHHNPKEIEQRINVFYPVSEVKNEVFYKDGEPHNTLHIFFLVDVYYFEIVVRNPAEKFPERCEIFGDIKRGISLHSLEKLIKSDPLRKFIPRRRVK